MAFLNIYTLAAILAVALFLILVISGAILVYSGKSRVNKRNFFILIICRLVQLLFFFNIIVIFLLLLSQIFSIKFYSINHKTGSSYGWLNQADGYEIPMTASFHIPKQQVYIKAKVDSEIQTFSRISSFSWVNNQSRQVDDSLQSTNYPLVFGKKHAPYLSTDTIWNKIDIFFPVRNKQPTFNFSAGQRHFRMDKASLLPHFVSSIHFIPLGRLSAKAFVLSDKPWENFIFSLFTYFKLFAGLSVLFFLVKILSSFRKEQLFAQRNFAYVSFIGITLVFYQILKFILAFVCNKWIMGGILIHGISNMPGYVPNMSASMNIDYDINFPLLISGFLIVLVAQVFKEGFILQKEQELTI